MSYVIGIDAGGTKTHALAARLDGTIVGFGSSGPGSYEIVGIDPAKASILDAITQALEQGGESADEVELGCFALAGADFEPEDFDLLIEAMENLQVCKKVMVKNDAIAGLRAGVSKPYGICVIMGTGFNGAGIGKDGTEIRYFSQGPLFGDVGGGAAIARESLFHAMRAYDGRGPQTVLMQMAMDHWGAADMEQLARILYWDKSAAKKIPGMCPKVFDAAYDGDAVAIGIVRKYGQEAGISANAIIKRLGLQHDEIEVVLAGSVFKGKGPLMLDVVNSTIHEVAPKAKAVTPKYEPVVGAVIIALEKMGVVFEGQVSANLDASVPEELRRRDK